MAQDRMAEQLREFSYSGTLLEPFFFNISDFGEQGCLHRAEKIKNTVLSFSTTCLLCCYLAMVMYLLCHQAVSVLYQCYSLQSETNLIFLRLIIYYSKNLVPERKVLLSLDLLTVCV